MQQTAENQNRQETNMKRKHKIPENPTNIPLKSNTDKITKKRTKQPQKTENPPIKQTAEKHKTILKSKKK